MLPRAWGSVSDIPFQNQLQFRHLRPPAPATQIASPRCSGHEMQVIAFASGACPLLGLEDPTGGVGGDGSARNAPFNQRGRTQGLCLSKTSILSRRSCLSLVPPPPIFMTFLLVLGQLFLCSMFLNQMKGRAIKT